MTSQPSLFADFEPVPTFTHTVAVRSYTRRVKGTEPLQTAPHNGTATSQAAARAVAQSGQQATQLVQVLQLVTRAGARGITRADIAAAMGKPQSTICARVSRLLDAGSIRETDEPRIPDVGGSVKQKVLVRVK